MVQRISILSVFVSVFFHMLVFAHGGETHILGTVTALDAQHVVVKTKEGQTLSIRVTQKTKYREGETAATGADLKVGDRVYVEAARDGDTLTASEIRFASASEKPSHEGQVHRQ